MRLFTFLVSLVLVGIYFPVLAEMVLVWMTDSYAVHGLFVPAFSAYFFLLERDRLREVAAQGDRSWLVVMLLALSLLAVGRWGDSLFLKGVSIVVAVAGVVLWRFGLRFLKQAVFPVGFLLFMVPLPRLVVNAVTLDLQLFAAGFAAGTLQLLNVPVYLNGVLIELPTMTLEVAEICNGLRFLTALVVLTVAFAHISQRSLPRKLILVAATIPIAILANAVRVAIIAAGGYYVGPEVTSGPVHHIIGKGVWFMTLIPLVAMGLLLRRGRADLSSVPSVEKALRVQAPGVKEEAASD